MSIQSYWPDPSKKPRATQVEALDWLEKQTAKYLVMELPVGCHIKDTPILMYDGSFKHVQDIVVGDQLMGVDSTPRNILRLYRGREQMYTISPIKGDSFIVNENHILSLITTPARRSGFDGDTIINISVKDYINKSNDFKRNTKLYRASLINFSNKSPLLIDPYFFGVLMGDGHIKNSNVMITTMDSQIEKVIFEQAELYGLKVRVVDTTSKAKMYYISTQVVGGDIKMRPKHILRDQLKELGVYETSSFTKFIPFQYKTSSAADRLQLLAGLLDTDGYYKNVFNYCTKSPRMMEDVKFIARSLGFSANSFVRVVNNEKYYDISISGNLESIPTKIPRKQASIRRQKKRVTVSGFDVIPYGHDDFYGFELDSDHLYMLKDFTVTHNSGKSILGITYSRYLQGQTGDAFILTPQKILQKQYENDFETNSLTNLVGFYGKANYQCYEKKTNCQTGDIIRPRCGNCTHKMAKSKAISSSNVVLNYDLALLQFNMAKEFPRRQLMVCDEGHSLESLLCEFDAIHISKTRLEQVDVKWKLLDNLDDARAWVIDVYLPALNHTVTAMEREIEPLLNESHLIPDDLKRIKTYLELKEHLDSVLQLQLIELDELHKEWILVHDKLNIKFKRLHASKIFHKYLGHKAERFLIMSATIPNHVEFCRDLGLPQEEVAFISLKSEFPKENRKVVFIPHMKMNYEWDKPHNAKNRIQMLEGIRMICDLHANEKGIIHTASFNVSEWVTSNLKVPQHIFHHNPDSGDDRNSVIKAFMEYNKPAILVSPSITEGLDLKYDFAKFGIVIKVPYPYLGDQWVKARMELSGNWYQRQAIIQTLQACGRIVRAADDEGTTYILDGSWEYLYKKQYNVIPKWWHEAYSRL